MIELTDAKDELTDSECLNTDKKRPMFMFNGPSAMGKERLDDECKDRHDKDLEVEGEDWGFVEHEVVAKVGDSVVVRRVAHQRRVERVENPYYADLVRQMKTRERWQDVNSIEG